MYFMELANKLKARKKEYTCFIRRDKEIFAFSSKNPYFRGEKDFLTVSDVFEKERTKKIVPKATDDAGYITYLLHNAQNDVKKLEAIDEYLHEVYRKAEHSFKSKTGTSFNQTSLNVRLDAIAQYIEDNFDKCIEAAKCAIHISEI